MAVVGEAPLMKNLHGQIIQAVIAAGVERARLRPALATLSEWWLTLCITGTEAALVAVANVLASQGGENLDGADTGFLNAKLRVASDTDQIIAMIERVDALATAAGAELVTVDADSSERVEESAFEQLWVR
jgi:hypothetical protein